MAKYNADANRLHVVKSKFETWLYLVYLHSQVVETKRKTTAKNKVIRCNLDSQLSIVSVGLSLLVIVIGTIPSRLSIITRFPV